MKIIGIDPGSTRAGYGIIDFNTSSQDAVFIDGGIIKTTSKDKHQQLLEIRNSLSSILKLNKPEIAGIERLYFNKNVKTAIEVAQARGVLIVCLKDVGIEVNEFTPSAIKMGLTGYGVADKKSMEKMVRKTLNIEDLHQPDDVYDALAIALVVGYTIHTKNIFGDK